MPNKNLSLREQEIAACLARGLEEQNSNRIKEGLAQSRPTNAARALLRFGPWYRSLFLAVADPPVGLRVFRELPARAQAEVLREMNLQDAARLLAPADFGERVFFLSLLEQKKAEHLARHLSNRNKAQLPTNLGASL